MWMTLYLSCTVHDPVHEFFSLPAISTKEPPIQFTIVVIQNHVWYKQFQSSSPYDKNFEFQIKFNTQSSNYLKAF